MNDFQEKHQNDFLISFSDLKRILRTNRRKIYLGTLVFAFLGLFYGLLKPVQYEAAATFKEKGKAKSSLESMPLMMLSGGQSDSGALMMMTSRKLVEELVKNQGLQGVITKDEYRFPFFPLTTIKNNLIIEYALFKRSLIPVIDPPVKDIKTEQVVYGEEVPLHLRLIVTSPEDYIVVDSSKNTLGKGIFGVPFTTETFAFTLKRLNDENLKDNTYFLSLFPVEYVAENMLKQFVIEPGKLDKNLVKIIHTNSDRIQAAKNVNGLMAAYLKYIQCEHDNLCQVQIGYLRERQDDMGNQLETMMQTHAEKLSSELSLTGFASSDKAMEFLAATQQKLKEKLFLLNFEVQRFGKVLNEGHLDSELISFSYDLTIINKITAEKRLLKQQYDSLSLALKNFPENSSKFKKNTEFDTENLDEVRLGLDLKVAKDIYVQYVKELSDVDAKMIQHEFVINQMDDPEFEITSLSTVLKDSISVDMIVKTSALLLALKDQDNRSIKEQDRLLKDLAIQKRFLKTHVEQSMTLVELHQNFVKDKIRQLQGVLLVLIQEQLAILDKQLKDLIISALGNLEQEKKLIDQNLAELRLEMAVFPQQWAAEQLISQQMGINRSLVEEVSKIVESKNITNNLEKFQSTPIDKAFPPIHPKSPRLLLLAFVGAAGGALLSCIWVLGVSIASGIAVSAENLLNAGYHVSGSLSGVNRKNSQYEPLLDSDLDTLRRLIVQMHVAEVQMKVGQSLLLLEGNGPDYSCSLADLMSKQGLKIIILNLQFNEFEESSATGMLQYLEGKVSSPKITKMKNYDYIASGGICRYSNELLISQQFQTYLHELLQHYDCVIAISKVSLDGAEAENLLEIFPKVVVTISGESIHQLNSCLSHAQTPENKMSFVFV